MESASSAKSSRRQRLRKLTPYLILAAGLLFTLIVSYRLAKIAEAEDRARFQVLVKEVHASTESRLENYTAVLRAGAAFFSGSEDVTEAEFRTFVNQLGLAEHYPGVQGMGFSLRLKPEDRAPLVAKRRREGADSFQLSPESQRDESHAIVYLEPQEPRNRAGLGFDMTVETTRREPMERARATGAPAASGRVILFKRVDPQAAQQGFLIYVPVYGKGQQPTNAGERWDALFGFVFSAFRADDFFRGIVTGTIYENIDFQIYDGLTQTPENLIHRSTQQPATGAFQPRFAAVTNMKVAGRPWTINSSSTPAFDSARTKSWVPYTLSAGILISLLFFAVTRSQIRARAKAELSEEEVRESEAKARQILAERERAEAAVNESEERYRELVENANDVVFSLDLAGNVTSINRAVESLTGYSQSEFLQMNMDDFLTPNSVKTAQIMTQRKLAGEERTSYEVDVIAKDGHTFTLEISSRLSVSDGKPNGIQGVARDITNRRLAEEALREADQRALSEYERLLEKVAKLAQILGTARDLPVIFSGLKEFALLSVPCDGLFVSLYDPVRNVRTACYGWADGEDLDTSEFPPMPVTATGPNSRAVRTNEVVITNDYMAETRGHPAVLVGPDNGLRPQSSLSAPMAVMGRIIGTIEVQTYEPAAYREEHVTAMRLAANLAAVAIENVGLLERESTARASAEESNRLKDEFLATVSHELRTPLTAILGWARMLESGGIESDMARRAVETIMRNAKAQAQIIEDILDVSRIITGKLALDLRPVQLESLLEAAVNVVRPTAEAKGINVEVDLGGEPVSVSGDQDRLQQVFWNLFSNAVKFTPAGGKVSVKLRRTPAEAEIEVTDTGQGISKTFLPFVFDRFRQADSTSTRQHGGLGLGLAIARHLVEIHGGKVEASSDGAGKGSSFTVRLPLAGVIAIPVDEPPAEAESKEPLKLQLSGIDVLIVDDDDDTLELLKAALTQRGANVTAVSSADECLEAIKAFRPHVLISDIAMPDQDGYELIRKVIGLNLQPRIPSIAITAYAQEEDRERALAAGYNHYLAKPVELAEFISTVAEAARNGFASPSLWEGERGEGSTLT
ncbi:MAG TPA: CHASE domain-containing protein [Pyrinomonadaceae bacterium]|nr:CHASE domain-containing protein [Pyrinomonadaceae bacterium]